MMDKPMKEKPTRGEMVSDFELLLAVGVFMIGIWIVTFILRAVLDPSTSPVFIAAIGGLGGVVCAIVGFFYVNLLAEFRMRRGQTGPTYTLRSVSMSFVRVFRRSAIKRPLASRLLAIVDFFFSPTTVEDIFQPLVGDLREQYLIALRHGRTWKARWIRVRLYYSFWHAVWSQTLGPVVERVVAAIWS